jgi:hypothetical protein
VILHEGTYTLLFGTTAADTGTYLFRLVEVPPADEFAIAIGDTVADGVPAPGAGNLEVPGAVDIYRFEATAGQPVTFDVLDSNGDLSWVVNAPDGSEHGPLESLARNPNAGDGSVRGSL